MRPGWILRLYPRAWRLRYGDEMAALLEERPATFATYLDLFLGALDASLNYVPPERMVPVAERLKADIVVRFCAFVLFGFGWLLLARLNDPVVSFAPVAALYPGLTLLLDAFKLAGVIAAIGIALGGLPLVGMAVRRAAVRRQPDVLRAFWWAAASALLFALATLAVAEAHPAFWIVTAYLALSLGLLLLGTIAVAGLVLKADLEERELRRTSLPAILVLYGMAGSLIAAVALGVLVASAAPSLLVSQDVGPGMFSVSVLLLGLGTVLAFMGARHGWLAPAGGTGTGA